MIIIFNIKNHKFLTKDKQKIVIPNILKLNETITVQGFFFNQFNLSPVEIKVSCLDVFKDIKKIHFKKGFKQERDKTKGFRAILNLVEVEIKNS